MKAILKYTAISAIILIFTALTTSTAQASFFDRAKEIYNIPEQFEEIQQEYDAATKKMKEELAEQREQLEDARNQADELLRKQEQLQQSNEYFRKQNEQYREQTDQLIAENQNLLIKIEKIEQERKSFYYKLATIIGVLIGLCLLYTLSVRIWRFCVWRKQKNSRGVYLP